MDNIVDVGFAVLHEPLFLGSKNFDKKLDGHRYKDLKMQYHRQEAELIVTWLDKVAHIPCTNVAYYVPGVAEDRKITQIGHPTIANVNGAQVETPFGHVHAGPGKGKK